VGVILSGLILAPFVQPAQAAAQRTDQHAERTYDERPHRERVVVIELFEEEHRTNDEKHVAQDANGGVNVLILLHEGAHIYETHPALQSWRYTRYFKAVP
jgi:hypothetical protein